MRILMVCLGNICRSPTAHGVFHKRVLDRNLQNKIVVDSAGTGSWHIGKGPDPRSTKAALSRGYQLSHLLARQVEARDFQQFDYLLAMDRDNLTALQAQCPQDSNCRIELFLEYSNRAEVEVPDPYYSGVDGFELVLDMVEEASDRLLETLIQRHFHD
ncbi:MAG: low molecular weight phosphotyrosine protein phosphatase [Gammaproteobacteria bacterium]|nr:low molecular weight phosphotyrosine protein phosphatase [Gammaproteobacteria bacterium]